MMRISHSFLELSWRRTMKTTHLGEKNSLPRKKEPIPFPPKKIQ
jgi:hypothetical protein